MTDLQLIPVLATALLVILVAVILRFALAPILAFAIAALGPPEMRFCVVFGTAWLIAWFGLHYAAIDIGAGTLVAVLALVMIPPLRGVAGLVY